LLYFLYIYEYGTLRPVEVTLRRGMGWRENNGRDELNQVRCLHIYGNVTKTTPVKLLYTNKDIKNK
jgi:hypothetical protein